MGFYWARVSLSMPQLTGPLAPSHPSEMEELVTFPNDQSSWHLPNRWRHRSPSQTTKAVGTFPTVGGTDHLPKRPKQLAPSQPLEASITFPNDQSSWHLPNRQRHLSPSRLLDASTTFLTAGEVWPVGTFPSVGGTDHLPNCWRGLANSTFPTDRGTDHLPNGPRHLSPSHPLETAGPLAPSYAMEPPASFRCDRCSWHLPRMWMSPSLAIFLYPTLRHRIIAASIDALG
ncbi:hypothetical protein BJ508DRAFT_331808 [Ascobolus immersus RN42]|uniref:Uncharacterized protein n=1 Tax=Ascobolus immersus RN42 TaxID=1160509 RepID=A0A3N4HPP9_ASCIM|nr:hypothetical protein BJ508DRAFT_331808 [Ascobolus immersus RN42]